MWKGTDENTPRLIRRFLEKESYFNTQTKEELKNIGNNRNNNPQKVWEVKTPNEMWMHEIHKINLIFV